MGLMRHVTVLSRSLRTRVGQWILAYRIRYRYPTLLAHPTAIWDYGYSDLDAIELGDGVSVGAFAEILVYKRSPRSGIPGRLVIGDRSIITAGVNIRAAGGTIRMGRDSGVGQHTVLVASNHAVRAGERYLASSWDESRTGITIGDNVWISANCVILPGSRIGNNSVIGAGSVVTGDVPPNEIWAGVPARKIKDVPGSVPAAGQSRSELNPSPPG